MKMSEAKAETIRLSVSGSAITTIIRDAAERGDIVTVFDIAPNISVKYLRAILEGRAEIVGEEDSGLTVNFIEDGDLIDIQERFDSFMKRQRESDIREGRDLACEAVARWAKYEGWHIVAEELENETWVDPRAEGDED